MPKREIFRYAEDGETWLSFKTEYDDLSPDKTPPTLEELVDKCDQDAESRNNHGYVGTHKLLAQVMLLRIGREKTTEILNEISEYGGLDGMNGCGGEPDAYVDLGLTNDWAEYIFKE